MNTYNYKNVSSFGSNTDSPVNNPLTYCINNNMDSRFLHGGHADIYGQHSRPCQLFLSQYCAEGWDGFCEYASKNTNTSFPDQYDNCNGGGVVACRNLNAGDALIHNTAARKYLVKMNNARQKFEPFDPTVPSSPMISYWVSDNCSYSNPGIPEYAVDPKVIDNDIVMNKILAKPEIAAEILINIYNTMKRYGILSSLKNTKIGNFYDTNPYFKHKGGIS